MRHHSVVAAIGLVSLVGFVGACVVNSGPPATTAPPTQTAAPTAVPTAPAPTETAAQPPASTTTPPPADVPGVLADESNPPGTQPLNDEEAREAEFKCARLGKAIEKDVTAARKAGKSPYDAVLEALKNPPKVAGMDVPRCADLMRRDLIASQALNRESEAKNNLKAISVGLSRAMERTPPEFCASAPSVPPALDTVRNGPWKSDATSWSAPGWKCTGFDLIGAPQYFQYELKTDPATKSFEIIARGFPVTGQATELYVRGKVENGKIQPQSKVYRR